MTRGPRMTISPGPGSPVRYLEDSDLGRSGCPGSGSCWLVEDVAMVGGEDDRAACAPRLVEDGS